MKIMDFSLVARCRLEEDIPADATEFHQGWYGETDKEF